MNNGNTIKHSSQKLHGGLLFTKAVTPPIRVYPVPAVININLVQHQGAAGNVIVKTGENVHRGQALTDSGLLTHVPVHASSAGKVTSISQSHICLLYTSPSPRDGLLSRMPSSA